MLCLILVAASLLTVGYITILGHRAWKYVTPLDCLVFLVWTFVGTVATLYYLRACWLTVGSICGT